MVSESKKVREILFRGKENPSGKWVEGFLVGHCHIGDWVSCAPIHSKTVGQFTGLTDQNGTKIFEGDIVRYTELRLGGEDVPVVNVVEFAEGGFAVNNYFINHWLWNSIDGNTQLSDIEVIGNIHDNPELLEGCDG